MARESDVITTAVRAITAPWAGDRRKVAGEMWDGLDGFERFRLGRMHGIDDRAAFVDVVLYLAGKDTDRVRRAALRTMSTLG